MIAYRTGCIQHSLIEAEEVQKMTPTYVWLLNGKRRPRKDGPRSTYHQTWEAARDSILTAAYKQLALERGWVENFEKYIRRIEALTPPAEG